jgi:hypothetical protein
MRTHTVATVALTLNTSAKWIDNVLSHHELPGVSRARQGIARRLNERAVLVLAIALDLSASLRLPMGAALAIASQLAGTDGPVGRHRPDSDSSIELTIDLEELERNLARKLAAAAEIAPTPRRGRPPKRRL